jgi:uncharacterized membrane protein YbhN (UPF0104 family)
MMSALSSRRLMGGWRRKVRTDPDQGDREDSALDRMGPAANGEHEPVNHDPPDEPEPHRPARVGRRLATLILLVLLAITLLAAVPGLQNVDHKIARVNPSWIALAVALELASELGFVGMFRLFFERVPAREARRLAWTELASGALLPGGGAGGLAIGGWLMHVAGAPTRWIVRRSEGVFFLSTAVSAAAMGGAGVALIVGAPGPHDFGRAVVPTIVALGGTVAVAALPWILRRHPRAPRWVRAISAGVAEAETKVFTRRAGWRPLAAIGYLGFDIAVLWVTLNALGPAPGIPALIMGYSIGYAANALPVPGGIGVLDAGLTGALALYGVSTTQAAAAVVIYHAIALWVPGVGGLYAYLRLRPRILERRAATDHSITDPQQGDTP